MSERVAPEERIELGDQNQSLQKDSVINIEDEERPFVNKAKVIYSDLREPETHIRNRTFFDKYFGSCLGDIRTVITYDELIQFYKLKQDANTLFDAKSNEFDELFRDLWNILTGEQLEDLQNEKWKNYGFQNSNPRSDIRGGGLLALKQMVNFATNYKEIVDRMSEPQSDFLFAVSSVNVTFFLIKYYHLSDNLVFDLDKKDICSRIALKSFCQALEDDYGILDKVHSLLLKDLFETWQELKKKIKGLNLMDFGMASNVFKKKYTLATKSTFYDDFEALRRGYNTHGKKVPLPNRRMSISLNKL